MEIQTIADQLYFLTVRLRGHRDGKSAEGTGFLYSVPARKDGDSNQSYEVLYLVTNKHVLDEASSGLELRMIRAADAEGTAPAYGQEVSIAIQGGIDKSWVRHPDENVDVVVYPIAPLLEALIKMDERPFFRSIGAKNVPSPNDVDRFLNSIEEVVFVGYPNALYDTANLTPIIRRGTTATPIALDYRGEPAFLIDASVFPGSSGSPVFILDRGTWESKDGAVNVGRRFFLLGVVASVHVREVHAQLQQLPTQLGVAVADLLNLGIVYKASAIDECVDISLASHGLERSLAEADAAAADAA